MESFECCICLEIPTLHNISKCNDCENVYCTLCYEKIIDHKCPMCRSFCGKTKLGRFERNYFEEILIVCTCGQEDIKVKDMHNHLKEICPLTSIRRASEYGHDKVNTLLVFSPLVDPSVQDNYAIRWASDNGNDKLVTLLLSDPRVDPSADNNYAIRRASYNGYDKVVALLLNDPRVDPSAEDNFAIIFASTNGFDKVVTLLLNDPRVAIRPSVKSIFITK